MDQPDFDTPGLAARLEHAGPAAADRLDFAAILVDADGMVRACNQAAAALPGLHATAAVGRAFYTEVAPSLANADIRGRIQRALERGALDLEFSHDGALSGLRGRMQPAAGGGFWLFLQAA
jgi:photoactive yellow protein